MQVSYKLPEEEIAYGPSGWLWDYLRRSRIGGFFLPLSGGADSSAVATIVHIMCCRLVDEIKEGNEAVLRDLRTVTGDANFSPTTSKDIAGLIFYTSCATRLCVVNSSHLLPRTRHGISQLFGGDTLSRKGPQRGNRCSVPSGEH
jgi:hypothetical protein